MLYLLRKRASMGKKIVAYLYGVVYISISIFSLDSDSSNSCVSYLLGSLTKISWFYPAYSELSV